jgi:hypothetical protein
VVRTHPSDKDARLKFKACERAAREAAFASAIMTEEEDPLCQRVVVEDIGECTTCSGIHLL